MPIITLNAHNIPIELLSNIALSLLAQQPLGPPTQLLPLLLTNKAIYHALSSNAFLAKVCRLKLDVSAIERRAFKPADAHLASHLVKSFRMIKQLRRKFTARTYLPHYLPSDMPSLCDDDELRDVDILPELYLLRLDSDGKNYAQLEYAGIRDFVRDFVLNRLYDDAELNDGWPLENAQNSCALWLMWMFTLKEDLHKETPEERESIVRKILPYCTLTHRYAASEAPPNHFHLPLLPHLRSHQHPLVHQLPTSSSDPSLSPPPLKNRLVYPHYLSFSRAPVFNYFNADFALSPPLASIAAKLLFVARRELFLIRAPPHVSNAPPANPMNPSPQPTVTDYERLNEVKAARVPMWAKWNWEEGCVERVNRAPVVPMPTPAPKTTTASTSLNPTPPPAPSTLEDEGDFEESKLWDTTWHRHRLCIDYTDPKPIFEPGKVYVPGTMDAQWEGKIWVCLAPLPGLQAFNLALQPQHAAFPGPPPLYSMPGMPPPPFSERTLAMTMQFSFLDVKEHWRVCGCVERGVRCDEGCDVEMRDEDGNESGESRVWTRVEKRPSMVIEEDEEEDEMDMDYEEDEEEDEEDEDDAMSSCASDYSDACSTTSSSSSSSSPARKQDPEHALFEAQRARGLRMDEHAACGVIPVPLPVMRSLPSSSPSSPPTPGPQDIDPAAPPIVPSHVASQLPPSTIQTLVPGQDGISITDPETGIVVPLPLGTNIDKVDFSMSNAWFPGRLGGVGVIRREGLTVGSVQSEEDKPRDEVVVFVNYEIPRAEGVRAVDGSCLSMQDMRKTLGAGKGRERREGMWVYETFDKKRKSGHEHHRLRGGEVELVERYLSEEREKEKEKEGRSTEKEMFERSARRAFEGGVGCCMKCLETARVRKEERMRMEDKARRALDGFLRDFGKREQQSQGDDVVLDDLDIPSFGFDFGQDERTGRMEAISQDKSSSSTRRSHSSASASSSSSSNTYTTLKSRNASTESANVLHPPHPHAPLILGDGPQSSSSSRSDDAMDMDEDAHPDSELYDDEDQHRARGYDREKVGVECDGVRDVILTGETTMDRRCWGRVGVYGRVRPWDGLVGILRVSQNNEERDTYMFIFGYVVGGENFVGEWRLAMTDPTAPAWSGAFVMSRKERI
ncbi:hypothetical protein BJ165DRAFT_441283 [Panaeolus papilionaceus]|nr:hypothetical protein BJ165DRAFT_441283 [Panaeolus papilionaceus]